jgi:hypothetical protein
MNMEGYSDEDEREQRYGVAGMRMEVDPRLQSQNQSESQGYDFDWEENFRERYGNRMTIGDGSRPSDAAAAASAFDDILPLPGTMTMTTTPTITASSISLQHYPKNAFPASTLASLVPTALAQSSPSSTTTMRTMPDLAPTTVASTTTFGSFTHFSDYDHASSRARAFLESAQAAQGCVLAMDLDLDNDADDWDDLERHGSYSSQSHSQAPSQSHQTDSYSYSCFSGSSSQSQSQSQDPGHHSLMLPHPHLLHHQHQKTNLHGAYDDDALTLSSDPDYSDDEDDIIERFEQHQWGHTDRETILQDLFRGGFPSCRDEDRAVVDCDEWDDLDLDLDYVLANTTNVLGWEDEAAGPQTMAPATMMGHQALSQDSVFDGDSDDAEPAHNQNWLCESADEDANLLPLDDDLEFDSETESGSSASSILLLEGSGHHSGESSQTSWGSETQRQSSFSQQELDWNHSQAQPAESQKTRILPQQRAETWGNNSKGEDEGEGRDDAQAQADARDGPSDEHERRDRSIKEMTPPPLARKVGLKRMWREESDSGGQGYENKKGKVVKTIHRSEDDGRAPPVTGMGQLGQY